MAENIDDLTISFWQDEREVVKELKKVVLTRGSWTTCMYLFQELNKKTEEYDAPKVSVRRYQKRGGVYKQQSKFNISSSKQANEIAAILLEWYPEEDEDKEKRLTKMAKDKAAQELVEAAKAAEESEED